MYVSKNMKLVFNMQSKDKGSTDNTLYNRSEDRKFL